MAEKKKNVHGAWGNLHVTLHEAKGLRDTETLGKQDPFAKLKLSKKEYRTKVHDGGGKVAKWDETFEFSLKARDDEEKISLHVVNHNVISDAAIADTTLVVYDLIKSPPNKKWFPVMHGGKAAGEVCISVVFKPALVLQIVDCKNLHDVQTLGKQDPYVIISIGKDKDKNKSKTAVCDNGGKNPKWAKEIMTFCRPLPPKQKPDVKDAKAAEPEFDIQVFDHNTLKDAFIGVGKVTWSEMNKEKGKLRHFGIRLSENGAAAGEVGITVTDWKFT